MPAYDIARSLALFFVAGLFEIGGGYLLWQYWRHGASWTIGLAGAITLVLYGIVPTYQPADFGRVYAAYGGIFVVMSFLWARVFDGKVPDAPDVVGGLICLAGVGVIIYWPRG
jgi:small multidrug resistance family-3 protein